MMASLECAYLIMSSSSRNRYTYDFTSSGFYTLVTKDGEPLYEKAFPYFEKVYSHLIWMLIWTCLILLSRILAPASWLTFMDLFFMSLIFLHLFLFGCRLTSLLLVGGLKPFLFPPVCVRLTRKMQQNPCLDILKSKNLASHPGLLVNLSLIQHIQGRRSEAKETLRLALDILPDHPHLHFLSQAYAQTD
jgi:hypothetical protein